IGMNRLWIKLIGEGDYLICVDRDSAKAVDVAFNVILEVAIGDRTQKWHSSMSKRTGVSCQLMSALGQKRTLHSVRPMSALPPKKADIDRRHHEVCFVSKADISSVSMGGRL